MTEKQTPLIGPTRVVPAVAPPSIGPVRGFMKARRTRPWLSEAAGATDEEAIAAAHEVAGTVLGLPPGRRAEWRATDAARIVECHIVGTRTQRFGTKDEKDDLAAIVASRRQHTLPTPPHAESLRLDLCHGCALDAAGIDDDGSTVAENYLQRRRVAFNPTTSSDYVQTDSNERRWRPGLNELGLTMCSACGLPPLSQLMPRPPFMPRPPTDSECIYCSNGFLQGFAEQYWEDHLRQQADRGAGPLPDDLPDPSAKIMNAETTSTDQSTDQSTPAAIQLDTLD